MPVQPTYPGVYIEELPSGVRTITGVSTSIAAFIGRALSGPANKPTSITSFGDFVRQFGGLWTESTLSYAVQDFYLNGGSEAIVVRTLNDAVSAEISLDAEAGGPPSDPLVLVAASEGIWANKLLASVNYDTSDPTASPGSPPTPDPELFNLIIYEHNDETNTDVKVEEYLNVSLNAGSSRYLPRVLEQNSARIGVEKDTAGKFIVPIRRPAETIGNIAVTTDGDDGDVPETSDYNTAVDSLNNTDLFNLLCIPPPTRGGDTSADVYSNAVKLCVDKRAILIVDPPFDWGSLPDQADDKPKDNLGTLGITGTYARNAALYYPLINKADPLRENQVDTFVPCGTIAGIMARTDTSRGVWKSPAGIDAALNGVKSLQAILNDLENGKLNQVGINCLRTFPVTGHVVWGARTLRGADQLADEYKYVAVRRTALFIEESLYRGTKWVVFEPNDEPLWAQIRLNIGAFMHNLFRQGAFQGKTPKEAYLVKCDKETTTQNDINLGIVNILVGFAPLKPAEFVIIKIQQLAGQIES
ncbi:MAG: phage tail sheath C-terminal domain-containing protein [Ginsengibacter sp.]